ncbi:MAG: TetR/AcrR family transcriptional regulator [Spirochaetales bacterium]|nr:TetR/AcrR family transcriptional regulator [Spirochaetales bacterium]
MSTIAAKQTNREIKRKRILEAALKLFARKGFGATAMDEVARSARLAKGTVYLYFKDKEDLYAQVVLDVLDRLQASVVERYQESRGVVEKLRGVAEAQILFFSRNRDFFRLFSLLQSTDAVVVHRRLFTPLLEKRRLLEAFLQELFEEGKREGAIRSDVDTPAMVDSFIGMVNQAVGRFCFEDRPAAEQPEERAAAVMSILLRGVLRR